MIPKYQRRVNGTYKEAEKLNSVSVEGGIGRGLASVGNGLVNIGGTLMRQAVDDKEDLYRASLFEKNKTNDLEYRSGVQNFDSTVREKYFRDVYNKNGEEREKSFANFMTDFDSQSDIISATISDPNGKKNFDIHRIERRGELIAGELKTVSDNKKALSNELTKAEINDNYNASLRKNNPDEFFSNQATILKSYCVQNGMEPIVGYEKSGLSKVSSTYTVNQVGAFLSNGDVKSASEMLVKFNDKIDADTQKLCQTKIKSEVDYGNVRRNSIDDKGIIQLHKANDYIDKMDGVGSAEKVILKERAKAEIKMQSDAKTSHDSYIVNSFEKKIAGKSYVDTLKIRNDEVATNPILKPFFDMTVERHFKDDVEHSKVEKTAQKTEETNKNNTMSFSSGVLEVNKKIVNSGYDGYNKDDTLHMMRQELFNKGYSTTSVEKITTRAMASIDAIQLNKARVSSYFYTLPNFPPEQIETATATVLSNIDNLQDMTKEQIEVEIKTGCDRMVLINAKQGIWGHAQYPTKLKDIKAEDNIRFPEVRKKLSKIKDALQSYILNRSEDGPKKNKILKSLYDYGALDNVSGMSTDDEAIEDFYTFGVLRQPMKASDKDRINERRNRTNVHLSEDTKNNLQSVGEYQDVISENYFDNIILKKQSKDVIK